MPVKAIVPGLKVWPALTPGDYKQFPLCASRGEQAIQMVSEPSPSLPNKDDHLGHRWKNATPFIWLDFSLNSKPLTYSFLSLTKMAGLKWNLRQSVSPGWCGSVDWALACKLQVAGLIPHQGTRLGCGPGPRLRVCKRQQIEGEASPSHNDASLPVSLPSCLSKNK